MSGVVPIIEPVRAQTASLVKTLNVLCESSIDTIVIANAKAGTQRLSAEAFDELLNRDFSTATSLKIGLLLDGGLSLDQVKNLFEKYSTREVALIHAGFAHGKTLAEWAATKNIFASIFLDGLAGGKLYQKKFSSHPHRVLVRDGFRRRRNRDYPDDEFFSDLHITYDMEGVNGFGDYSIVGDEYIEGGGPAYAVAIHLTYIDSERDDVMYVKHFVSDSQETIADPAGKFAEALRKLIAEVSRPESKIYESSAIMELRELNRARHYPGLGYVKKLSMKHHIETLSNYLAQRRAT